MGSDTDRHLQQQQQQSEPQHVDSERASEEDVETPPLLETESQSNDLLNGGSPIEYYYENGLDEDENHENGTKKVNRPSLSLVGTNSTSRHYSLTEGDETRTEIAVDTPPENDADNNDNQVSDPNEKPKPVSWSQLPKKSQLLILVLARLSEPLTQYSLQSYLFYQLKSFNPDLSDSAISRQAGIFQGSFTAAQFLTSVWWGRLADSAWVGRKRVLLVGLFGTLISCLGFGFSKTFTSAIIFRIMGGLMNSNVGVMRTMISEIIVEKK